MGVFVSFITINKVIEEKNTLPKVTAKEGMERPRPITPAMPKKSTAKCSMRRERVSVVDLFIAFLHVGLCL